MFKLNGKALNYESFYFVFLGSNLFAIFAFLVLPIILELICKQYSSAEIGEMLSLSTRTVDGHRNNLLLKTNSKNMAGLVIFAIQNKIINLEDSNTDIES